MAARLDHDAAFELLPWLVNGTLSGDELEGVEAHVRGCVTCRIAVRDQQRLRAAILEQPTVPLSAEQGFDQVLRQLDGRGAPRLAAKRFRLGTAPRRLLAFAAAATLAAVALLALLDVGERNTPSFSTLGETSTVDNTRIDVIFAEWVSEDAMRSLLMGIDATIVGGPTDIGRYTIRLDAPDVTEHDVAGLLERLGRDERIRFAGRTLIKEKPE